MDEYGGQNHPGQHWGCYRSKREKENDDEKDLLARLTDLLLPSTTDHELLMIPKRNNYCPYLRLNQRGEMDCTFWRVNDGIHNGAHFPLCAFTNNARSRSSDAALHRAAERFQSNKNNGRDNQKMSGKNVSR